MNSTCKNTFEKNCTYRKIDEEKNCNDDTISKDSCDSFSKEKTKKPYPKTKSLFLLSKSLFFYRSLL